MRRKPLSRFVTHLGVVQKRLAAPNLSQIVDETELHQLQRVDLRQVVAQEDRQQRQAAHHGDDPTAR